MDKLNIVVIEGTRRVKRRSIKASKYVYELGKTIPEIEVVFVDPNDFNFAGDGNDPEGKDPKYTAIVEKADGFFIVSPEYNHSIPGSLKRLLDSELELYVHKPVAFGGVSDGPWGGVRMIEALNQTVRELGLVSTFTDVHFPFVQNIFDEEGKLLDPAYEHRVMQSYNELIWMAKVLKYGRDTYPRAK